MKGRMICIVAGLLIGSAVTTVLAQDAKSRTEILRVALRHLGDRIPAGSAIDSSAVARMGPGMLEHITSAGLPYPVVNESTLFEKCGSMENCDPGYPAFLRFFQLTVIGTNAHVMVDWVRGRTGESGLRSGRSVLVRLRRIDGQWTVQQVENEEGYTIGPGRKR